MQMRECTELEWIFREGEPARVCYIVQSGKIRLSRNGQNLATIRAGECFGEIALLEENVSHGSDAQAVEPTVLQAMSMSEFHDHIHRCPPVLIPLLELAFEHLKSHRLNQPEAAVPHATPSLVTLLHDHPPSAPAQPELVAQSAPPSPTAQEVTVSGVRKIMLRAGSEALHASVPHPVEVMLSRLPYKIGGYPENGEVSSVDNNNLYLPCKAPPMVISRQHCQIEAQDDKLYLLDLGSRFNTILNDTVIGRGRGNYKAPLAMGDNHIRLGGYDSPYTLIVTAE